MMSYLPTLPYGRWRRGSFRPGDESVCSSFTISMLAMHHPSCLPLQRLSASPSTTTVRIGYASKLNLMQSMRLVWNVARRARKKSLSPRRLSPVSAVYLETKDSPNFSPQTNHFSPRLPTLLTPGVKFYLTWIYLWYSVHPMAHPRPPVPCVLIHVT